MPDNKINKGNARRKLLKGIAAGSGAVIAGKNLPDSWSRPVVDAVMLPAHAQTSMTSFTGTSGQEQGLIIPTQTPNSRLVNAIDGLVSKAHAGSGGAPMPSPMYSARTCIQQDGDDTVRVDCIFSDGYLPPVKLRASSVPVGGAAVPMSVTPCFEEVMKVELESIPSQSLLDNLNLIPDAHAGDLYDSIEVRIDSIDGNALGDYLITEREDTLEINLPVGECSPPQCPPGPPPI